MRIKLILVCCILLFLSGCQQPNDDDSLKVGVLLPLTGPEAYYGQDMLNGYQLAAQEINAAGGISGRELVLIAEDDASDPAQAVTAASRLVSFGVEAVIGGYSSGTTISAMRQFADSGLLFLVTAANSTVITELGMEQTFMLNAPVVYEAEMLWELAQELDTMSVAVLHQGDGYSQNLAEHLQEQAEAAGGKVATVEVVEKNSADVSPVVTAVLAENVDMVFWCGYHADGANVLKQLRRSGYQGPMACGDGAAAQDLILGAGSAATDLYVIAPPSPKDFPGGAEFLSGYEQSFSLEPRVYAPLAYDTVYLMAAAIEKAGGCEVSALVRGIAEIEFQGLTGELSFNDRRELNKCNLIIMKADLTQNIFVPWEEGE